jgi:hypothetical protein
VSLCIFIALPYRSNNVPYTSKPSHLPHLDISATLTPRKNKDRNWKGEWVLVFIISMGKNAASINFRQNADSGNNEAENLYLRNSSAVLQF